jgi:long-chain acyl-CoA synthetase
MTGKPSIDKPWLKYYPKGADKAEMPESTTYEYLLEQNKDYLDNIALEYYDSKITYGEMFKHIDSVAKAFIAQGVKQNDIVTLCLPNMPEAVYCFYALNKIGAVANMISPIFAPAHIIGCINLTESNVLVVLNKYYELLKGVFATTRIQAIVVVGEDETSEQTTMNGNANLGWSDFLNSGTNIPSVSPASYAKFSPAVIVYSSGSTGDSKGMVLTNESLVGIAYQYRVINCLKVNESRAKKGLAIIPIVFSAGINAALNMALDFGMIVILEPFYNSDIFSKDVVTLKSNYLLVTSTLLESLTTYEYNDIDMSFLDFTVASGEGLPKKVENKINDYYAKHNSKIKVMKAWGMCEFGPTVSVSHWDDSEHKGAGKPLPLVTVGVFDTETNRELSYNERGEVRVVTPCRMLEYYKNPEATNAFFKKGLDGQVWGCSGDIGYIDEEGNVFIEGRANDFVIAKNGEKVFLFDIDNILIENPDVQSSKAVGLISTDGTYGIPVVHIVLQPNFSGDKKALIRHLDELCRSKLPDYAVPSGYKIRDGFALNPGGKRDTLSLKSEREGFVKVVGEDVQVITF